PRQVGGSPVRRDAPRPPACGPRRAAVGYESRRPNASTIFMRILVAEDHPSLARSIADGLRDEGYAVDLTFDGNEAMHLASSNPYDAVVLDIMLPGRDGLSIIQALRRRDVRTPILCLTARDGVTDRVKGL